jgi:hypothetical protein
MLTAVDSSVLLDVLTGDPVHGGASLGELREARRLGQLLICPVVWAEVRGFFPDATEMTAAFSDAGIAFDPFDEECADAAGVAWREYRRGGGSRTRVVADFLVGAHARVRTGRLLTRDRGFYRRYFSSLAIVGQ